MFSLIVSVGVVSTGRGYHLHDGKEGVTAISASVFRFLATFVKYVMPPIGTIRMVGAWSGYELANIGETMTTVLTIIIFHNISFKQFF